MKNGSAIVAEQVLIQKVFYAYVLIVFGIENWLGHTITSFGQPVLISPEADNTYWIIHLTGFPQWIVSAPFRSIFFEIIILVSALCCFLFPVKKVLPILFSFLLILYMVTKNSFAGHHEHGLNGLMMMSFIFWLRHTKNFVLLFRALRFYVLFIFVSAACWKTMKGSVFEMNQFSEVLKRQHLDYAGADQSSGWFSFIAWFINHPQVGHLVLIAAVLLQGIFVIGFFTKKFDSGLFVLFFLFFAMNALFMKLPFYQLYPLALVFFPFHSIRDSLIEVNPKMVSSFS